PLPSLSLSEGKDTAAKGTLLALSTLGIIIDTIALYAIFRRSVTATKMSLVLWCLQTLLVVIGALIFREGFSDFTLSTCLSVAMHFLGKLLYGWALLVVLRDLRGQRRDEWGRLVNMDEKSVFDESER
ncbi:hypothetical protein BGZ98_002831, partial [Dissophora globulifera]